ncbi:hypothetical protein DL771_002919 [Monosporascus sp. 5C6A]|nr:hypothetical protein DL771_002919 [Monosporascus sp. 5C6A]
MHFTDLLPVLADPMALALHNRQIEGYVYDDSSDELNPINCRAAADLINRESGFYGAIRKAVRWAGRFCGDDSVVQLGVLKVAP